MKLEEFVSETLKQVLSGILTAQEHAAENGGLICPLHLPMRDKAGELYSVTFRTDREQMIEFDVAITTTDGAKTGGGIGIFVGPVGVGAKGESTKGLEHVSRVRFSVPIVFPNQNDPTVNK